MKSKLFFLILISNILVTIYLSASPGDMSVTIKSPVHGQRFESCTNIELKVDIQIQSGEVRRVYYFQNGQSLKSTTHSPYEFLWEQVPMGIYNISAMVRDKQNTDFYSDTVTVYVGPIEDGDLIINGEFECGKTPWILSSANGATGSFEIESEGWLSDTTCAVIEVQEPGIEVWDFMIYQPYTLIKDHTYEISFMADAFEATEITVSIQTQGGDWLAHIWQSVLIDGLKMYGPYTLTAPEDIPRAQFRLMFGGRSSCVVFVDAVKVIDLNWEKPGTSVNLQPEPPQIAHQLKQNYPNPFNLSTKIEYVIDHPGPVELSIYNLLGEPVYTLVKKNQSIGSYSAKWNGRDSAGYLLNSGIYIYQLKSPKTIQTRRMLLLK